MQAHDRFLPEWFNRIRSRQITLPRFQRFTAWGHGEVSGLLTTVLRGLPSGATLILEVGDEEKFKSRTMVDAPESGEKVTEQLLDGQQRLTALRRGRVKNDYDAFLSARAEVLAKAAHRVCEGKALELSELLNDAD